MEVATPMEARQRLNLKGADRANFDGQTAPVV
jgi:hypothetical protein